MDSYGSSIQEYIALLRAPKLVPSMVDFHPANPKQLYQDWNILQTFVRLFIGLSFFMAMAVNSLGQNNVGDALTFIIAAFISSALIVLLHHLPWHCLVKRSGCCGVLGYVIWGFLYLIGSIAILAQWYHLLIRLGFAQQMLQESQSPKKVPLSIALGPFLLGLADVFMFLGCVVGAEQVARARERDLESPLLDA